MSNVAVPTLLFEALKKSGCLDKLLSTGVDALGNDMTITKAEFNSSKMGPGRSKAYTFSQLTILFANQPILDLLGRVAKNINAFQIPCFTILCSPPVGPKQLILQVLPFKKC